MNKLTSIASTLILSLITIWVVSCDTAQNKTSSLDTNDVAYDSLESQQNEMPERKKTKVEIIEEKIGPGWEELGFVNAALAVPTDGKLTIIGLNGLKLCLYAKIIGNDIVYQATTKKIEEWGDAKNDLELVTKGNFDAYYQGEKYHFNATALSGWYFNLP